jgi:hypothetical protein
MNEMIARVKYAIADASNVCGGLTEGWYAMFDAALRGDV